MVTKEELQLVIKCKSPVISHDVRCVRSCSGAPVKRSWPWNKGTKKVCVCFLFFFPPLVLETFGSLASLWDREPQKCVRTWRRSGANASLRNNQAPCEDERYAAHVRGLVELAEFQSKENKQVSWAENRILWKRTAPARLAFSAFHTAGADTKWPNDQAKGSSTWDLQGSAVCSCCLHQN